MNKVVLVIVILIILLRKNENFGGRGGFSLMDITSFPTGLGRDIDITQWDNVNNSGSSGGLGDTGKTSKDAQMAASTEWNLQWGDVNRRCWSDATNSDKIIGFRKELKAGGGGKLWYLYSSDGKMPATGNQVQSKYAKVLATVGGFNIPQYIVCLKSRNFPNNPDCTWEIAYHTCVADSATTCNGYGTWNDIYSVTAGPVGGSCFDANGNALTNVTSASVPVTGGKCTLPLCPTGFDEGVPGTITTGTQVAATKFSGKTTLADCLKVCNTNPGCKYFQFNAGSPNSCVGYQTDATVSLSSGAVSSWVYTRYPQCNVGTCKPIIAAGGYHTLILKSDGSVWGCGLGTSGQLGNGTNANRTTFVRATVLLSGVVMIACGDLHSAALKSDGTVYTWGNNSFGQLGDNNKPNNRLFPWQMTTGCIAVACGANHTVVLKSDNTVWCVGKNAWGAVGNNAAPVAIGAADVLTLTQSQSLTGVSQIGAGGTHTVALKTTGSVWCWGNNYDGEIGDGGNTDKFVPTATSSPGDTGVSMVATGQYHVFALKTDGSVLSWGKNDIGQLGTTVSGNKLIPTAVSGLGASSGVVAIAGGHSHTVALKTDGSVLSWGKNVDGQLGTPVSGNKSIPTATGMTSGVVAIACGFNHTVVLKSDGSVWACGRNVESQLGDGTTSSRSSFVFITGTT